MDWTNNPNATGLALLEQHDLLKPEHRVKTAGQTHALFARPSLRELPISSAESTLLSAGYHLSHDDAHPEVLARIKAAAASYGVLAEVEAMEKFMDSQQTVVIEAPETTVKYAYTRDGVQAYPMTDELELDISSRGLIKDLNAGYIKADIAREAALAMCKRASRLKVKLPGRIHELGGSTDCSFARAEAMAASRVRHGMSSENASLCVELVKAAQVAGEGALTPEEAASLWADLDELSGVKYASCPTPHECLFGGVPTEVMEKAAAEHVLLAGAPFPAGVFAAIKEAELRTFLDKTDAEPAFEAVKLASSNALEASVYIAKTIPADQQLRILGGMVDAVKARAAA